MTKRYKTYERYAIVWGLTKQQVSSTEKFVLLALNEHADADGGNCFPSTNTLAEETGFTRQAVSKAIAKLNSKGLVSISKRFENGAQKSNNYTLNYGAMTTAAPCNPKLHPLSSTIAPPVNDDCTPCNPKLHPPVNDDCTDQIHSDQIHLPDPFTREERGAREKSVEGQNPLPEIQPQTPRQIKTDKYFGQRPSQLERQQAIAKQHSVQESSFESVDEQDEFYAYLAQRFAREPKVSAPQSEIYANAICLRICKGESQPKDRQYLKEFREGLTRLSRDEKLLAHAETVYKNLINQYAS